MKLSRNYWSAYAPHAMTDPPAAPLRPGFAGLPPMLVKLAELDMLRSEGEGMAARLEAADVPTDLELFPGDPRFQAGDRDGCHHAQRRCSRCRVAEIPDLNSPCASKADTRSERRKIQDVGSPLLRAHLQTEASLSAALYPGRPARSLSIGKPRWCQTG